MPSRPGWPGCAKKGRSTSGAWLPNKAWRSSVVVTCWGCAAAHPTAPSRTAICSSAARRSSRQSSTHWMSALRSLILCWSADRTRRRASVASVWARCSIAAGVGVSRDPGAAAARLAWATQQGTRMRVRTVVASGRDSGPATGSDSARVVFMCTTKARPRTYRQRHRPSPSRAGAPQAGHTGRPSRKAAAPGPVHGVAGCACAVGAAVRPGVQGTPTLGKGYIATPPLACGKM